VFPCDKIGTSDVALIMRSCNTDGELMQPSRSAAPIDASIRAKAGLADLGNASNGGGELWRADTFNSGTSKDPCYAFLTRSLLLILK